MDYGQGEVGSARMREDEERLDETYIENLSLGPVYSETNVSGVKTGVE